MKSFQKTGKNLTLPLGTIWLMNGISEYKGKQELYIKQSPQVLKTLLQMALIESAESSNRIEGVTVEKNRLKPLILGHARPRDRSEEEVAGYRKALDWIHQKFEGLEIAPKIIRELHRLSHASARDAGEWKEKNNDIIRRNPDGTVEIIFQPVPAKSVPEMMDQLCLAYQHSLSQLKYPPLYAVACLILDFLCIHPFRDGNGRVSRLLTLLALYQHGYEVGRYISLERKIEESKETYYEALQKSSIGWHEAKHEIEPWFNYFLGTLSSAYHEFEKRTHDVKSPRGSKTQMIVQAIETQLSEFSLYDIEKACPGISRDMIRIIFRRLKGEKKISCLGKGRSAKWKRIG